MATTYSISDLAKEFDLTTRAMRFYEDMGLLQPERTGRAGATGCTAARDRTRLKLTLRAKRLGLSLIEAKEIIDMYDSPRDTGPQLANSWWCWPSIASSWKSRWPTCRPTWTRLKVHQREARALLAKVDKKPRVQAGAQDGRQLHDAFGARAGQLRAARA